MRTVEEEESELEYERRVMREMNNIMFPPKQPTEPMNFWARLRRNISPGTAASLLCLMGSGYCMYLAVRFFFQLLFCASPGASCLPRLAKTYCFSYLLQGEGQVFATAIAWSTLLVTAATIIIEFFAKVQESLRQVPRVAWVAISNSETRLKKHISKQMSDLEIRLENKINNKTFENENKGLTP